jgi:hypothetical protein
MFFTIVVRKGGKKKRFKKKILLYNTSELFSNYNVFAWFESLIDIVNVSGLIDLQMHGFLVPTIN